jgi:hypothetical protein
VSWLDVGRRVVSECRGVADDDEDLHTLTTSDMSAEETRAACSTRFSIDGEVNGTARVRCRAIRLIAIKRECDSDSTESDVATMNFGILLVSESARITMSVDARSGNGGCISNR